MERKILSLGREKILKIDLVPGDLRLTGWDENEIKAKTNGSSLELLSDGEVVTLSCDNDLVVSLPRHLGIEIGEANGDASLRVLEGVTKLGQINGDLALRNIGDVEINILEGDLVVRHASGALKAEKISGDASIRDIQGEINISNIDGDLHLRNPHSNVNINVGGDIVAYIHPQAGEAYQLKADSDVLLRLPVEADVMLTLSSEADLGVKIPGVEDTDEASRSLTLGTGSAKMNIVAGGDLLVTTRSDDWEDWADFDISLPFIGADFPGLSDDFAENIAKKAEEAARKVEEKMRQSEYKFRAAGRRAERHAKRAERHIERIRFGKHPFQPRAPRRPVAPSEPVSEEERLLILKMLEEKKITAADAEKLLAALE